MTTPAATPPSIDDPRRPKRDPLQHYRVGRRLARLRHEAGLTQAQLARAMGTSQPRIARLEGGFARLRFSDAADIALVPLGAFDPDSAWTPAQWFRLRLW